MIKSNERSRDQDQPDKKSGKQLGGNLASVFGKLPQHLFVQPDVHGSRVILIARELQLSGEVITSGETAIHADQFHEIDDGLLAARRGQLKFPWLKISSQRRAAAPEITFTSGSSEKMRAKVNCLRA